MAHITENSMTIKLQALSVKENGCGVVDVEVTVDEARDLMRLLNNRFVGDSVQYPVYPSGVRNWKDRTNIPHRTDGTWEEPPIKYYTATHEHKSEVNNGD